MDARTCSSCGEVNPEKFTFCNSCGVRIKAVEAADAPSNSQIQKPKDYGTLDFIVDSVLSDGVLHPSERDYVRTKGIELGLSTDAALAYLDQKIAERGYIRILDVAESDASSDPIQVFVNRNKMLHAGESGVIELELKNVGASAYERVNFSVSSKPPVDEPLETITRRCLDAQQKVRSSFSIVPKIAGENLIKIRLVFFDPAGRLHAYTGYTTVLVERCSDSPFAKGPNISVSFTAEKMMGFDASNLVQAAFLQEVKEKQPVFPKEEWQRINLNYDYDAVTEWNEQQQVRPRVVVPRPDASQERSVGAFLAIGSGEIQQSVRFLSKPYIKLGRLGEANDIALVYLPTTESNQNLSLGISREHCEIRFDGREFTLRNLSRNGTFVNGVAVEANNAIPLLHNAEVLIGPSKFKIRFQLFKEEHRGSKSKEIDVPKDRNWEAAHKDLCQSFDYFGEAVIDAARIQRVDNAPQNEYCILVREALIGRNHQNCIVIKDKSVSEIHARILFSKGQYFLEDCGSENGTFVAGQKLQDREICVLCNGLSLRIGEVECSFQTIAR